jgi:hypothetical protein
MSTERYIQIRCDICRIWSEMVETSKMSETELRHDLTKRLGWISFRTDVPRGRKDVCPNCQKEDRDATH